MRGQESDVRIQASGVRHKGNGQENSVKIRIYMDLSVWQKSMDLVEECYRLTDVFS